MFENKSGETHNDLCTDVPFDGATGFRDPQLYTIIGASDEQDSGC
jgi:hypothetical protein